MKTLKHWVLHHQAEDRVELLVDGAHRFLLYVLAPGLMRVLIKQRGELRLNRTWSIAPQQDCRGRVGSGRAARGLRCRAIRCAGKAMPCRSAPGNCG